ncbi:MAG: excinuclease ABC subunit B [Deltaproteobacteria bacterium RIFCSPLOWO2_02_FULL_50_16]|nr:MAG: excinuclease ABC subunit B [Deltaproteobacteria bacterium GWA2_50_8]OGQ30507.1 MAG: excinuclease ABC subunit B [Deltaproteobacteria bacterium RIFCSPHIGHO2_02_FULL_50_15]OGQ56371.1 MAG: excinuclease ABC subunit B [Deltaproteobacteria bacterium RIFCSPLOWO2_02_FULL_50_16]OGQ67774.1 MAG: excinuclease ABC subunit B [Deltaproteobacteria bacterium RIFCSPLOWO2_12_FULL_50_11]
MPPFKITTHLTPQGDQPRAIKALVQGIQKRLSHQTLLGVTGSGKTFTMAHVIQEVQRPTLIIAPNKTLAAQLYGEMKELFPENAVEYFVSYYDYYQPEAYVPTRNLYIEKDSSINEEIDKLRHSATRSLLTRGDVIIVASVSCIYGLGSPEAYHGMLVLLEKGREYSRNQVLLDLVKIQYERNDYDFHRGTFRVRGDVVEIFPAYEEQKAIRVVFFGDDIEEIYEIDPLTGRKLQSLTRTSIFPASHYVAEEAQMKRAILGIKKELKERIQYFYEHNQPVEQQRIEQRTRYDVEMMEEIGFCKGIENYSRHITGRRPGEAPPTLLDYFPKEHLVFLDESHITVPQLQGMYRGDRSRKENLVDYGFRLPSALDNRPLRFDEFEKLVHQMVFVSATPADYEYKKSGKAIVEQVIRPTGLVDPQVEVRSATTQVDDLLGAIHKRIDKGERVLVTTLTKKMAEDLTKFYQEVGLKVRYLHSDVDTLERVEIIRQLREGKFDVLIGINLLREGLDLPEVSLVAILDADKEGFLRSARSLIQTFGRAARHIHGRAILYADNMTGSMKTAIEETERRRQIQRTFNEKNHITPKTIVKSMSTALQKLCDMDYFTVAQEKDAKRRQVPLEEIPAVLESLRSEMKKAAGNLEFERAAELRDQIQELQARVLTLGIKN